MRRSFTISYYMKILISMSLFAALLTGIHHSARANDTLSAQEKFEELVKAGIFQGINHNGDAALDENMTRAQLAKVISKLMGLEVLSTPAAPPSFSDVSTDYWAYGYVEVTKTAGIFDGYGNGKFGPNDAVTIEQLSKTLIRMLDETPDPDGSVNGNVSEWAKGYVAKAEQIGLLPEEITNYKQAATRQILVESSYQVNTLIETKQQLAEEYNTTGEPSLIVDSFEPIVKNAIITLSGSVSPVERITVNGIAATITNIGRWSAAITLKPGKNTISIIAIDGKGASKETAVDLIYDVPPVLHPVSSQTGTVGYYSYLSLSAVDQGGDTLSYHASGLPGGLSVNSNSGVISGTPVAAGNYTITVTASDPGGQQSSQTFTWTINPAPVYVPSSNPPIDTTAPVITSSQDSVYMGGVLAATSNEAGTAYLTHFNVAEPTAQQLEQLFNAGNAEKQSVAANTAFVFDTLGIVSDHYSMLNIYVVDAAGNVSICWPISYEVDTEILSMTPLDVPEPYIIGPSTFSTSLNKHGWIYIVKDIPAVDYTSMAVLDSLVDDEEGIVLRVSKNIGASANTSGLTAGSYRIIAFDMYENRIEYGIISLHDSP